MAENTTYDFDLRNSKKISEFKRRDTITKHQENSWIALAQYNNMFGSYHNVAINLSAITGYSISAANENTAYYVTDKVNELISAYNVKELADFAYAFKSEDYEETSYGVSQSSLAYNMLSYATSYIINTTMWQYFPTVEDVTVNKKYLYTEDGMYILTDRGKMINVL